MNPYAGAYRRQQVVNRKLRRRSLFSGGAVVCSLIFLICLAMVYKRTAGQQLLLDVQSLKLERTRLITEQSVYLGQKQEYLSRERIIAYARERLGLDFPDPAQVHWVQLEPGADVVRPENLARR